jgi:hypothetical protein
LLPVFPVSEFGRVGYVEAIQEGSDGKDAGNFGSQDIAGLEAVQIQFDPFRHQMHVVPACVESLRAKSWPERRERRGE